MPKFNTKTNVYLLISLIILNLLDFITTFFCLNLGATEANPIMAHLMESMGTIWALLYVKLVIIAVLLPYFGISVYYPKLIEKHVRQGFTTFTVYLLMVVNAGYVYVVLHNLNIIYILNTL